MAKEGQPRDPEPPEENPETAGERDTDEAFSDHAELAPEEGRISVRRGKKPDQESIRRRANTGDAVDEAGDKQHKAELDFSRNQDFTGDEGRLPSEPDYSRGSGYLGTDLVGEEEPDRPLPGTNTGVGDRHGFYEGVPGIRPQDLANRGFDLSESQQKNKDAALRDAAAREALREAAALENPESNDPSRRPSQDMGGDARSQGREGGARVQATGSQRFGRDMGAQGLSQENAEGEAIRPEPMTREHRDWVAVLGRLGGSSPGSEENLLLAEKFHMVQFPCSREEVLRRLGPKAEFPVRQGITVDLRHAVESCRLESFRNLNDLIDCVKDELRRMETEDRHA